MLPPPIQYHEIANIFPLIEGKELDALTADMKQNGLLQSIILYGGKILDGRNRYRACLAAGIVPRFENYTGPNPLAHVISLNLHRRHLDESQRAMVAARIATLSAHRPAGSAPIGALTTVPHLTEADRAMTAARIATVQPPALAPTQEQAAEMVNVARRSVQRARVVQEHADPALVRAVEQGKVSVSLAAKMVEETPEVQRLVAEKATEGKQAKTALKEIKQDARKEEIAIQAAAAPKISDRYELFYESCESLLTLPPARFDWIVTDPPYPEEFLPCFDLLGRVAKHALKVGGSLLCMSGQIYLPHVFAALAARLTYQWTLVYLTPGGQAVQIFPRKVNTFWKPILWFVNGPYAGDWIGDVTRSDTNDNDKSLHIWGQSASGMRDLMTRFVRPGQTVLDPFMGAGTTGVCALELGAHFTGFDVEKSAFDASTTRLAAMS